MRLPRPAALVTRATNAVVAALRSLLSFLQRRGLWPAARTVLRHWVAEKRTLRQGFIALSVCISVTLVAGLVLGAMDGLLEELPGLLILAPAAIGMRGAVFAALGARLGTGMLTGLLDLTPRRRSFLGQNVEAAGLLTVVTAVLLAVLARAFGALVGLPTIALLDLVVVSMLGAVVSSVVVLVVVVLLARTAQRQAWDMDAIGTPVISATADITTLPALAAGTLALEVPVVSATLGWAFVAAGVAALWGGWRNHGDTVRQVVQQSLPVLLYAGVMGILAGSVLEARIETLVDSPALLVAIPPFIASAGAIGGILSARLSSQLHLGLVEPNTLPDAAAVREGSLSVFFGLLGYATVGVLTQAASAVFGFSSPGALQLLGVTLTGGLLAVLLLFVVAYYAATASYRFGLDPDNVGIPIVTASMDFLGILCLVAAIVLVGV